MKELILCRCEHCGNLIAMVNNSGATPACCGEEMRHLKANTQDAAAEKHIPVIEQKETHIHIAVGEKEHPMLKEHHIEWIILLTDCGAYSRALKPNNTPEADFTIAFDETAIVTYAYCNLHGLWMKQVGE